MSPTGQRSVLLIAFHFPPFGASSGVQRTLSFAIHLRKFGWHPVVLTADPKAYERVSPDQLRDIPSEVPVHRSLALDAARHLAVKGRYWSKLALPDRWSTWWLSAVPLGLRLIRRHSIRAIWSTYPIATAHRIGATLARATGIPWIADFRDPMVEWIDGQSFPSDPKVRRARLKIERTAAERASKLVFCTEAARDIVLERYPTLDTQRTAVVSNGFEEQAFQDASTLPPTAPTTGKRVLLHSGTIYLGPDRDPSAVLSAIRMLKDRGVLSADAFELRLRDPSNEDALRRRVAETGVEDMVSILPPLPYRAALREMLDADGLLLLQGKTSNPAVPAKLYEYLRAGRPILACVHDAGETARTLRSLGIDTLAPLTDSTHIASLIERWWNDPDAMASRLPARADVSAYSRESLTRRLAELLEEVRGDPA
jgi:hypothetical protein